VTSFGPAPSGPPVQSMGGRARSVFLLSAPPAGVWATWSENWRWNRFLGGACGGGHTDALHVFDLPFGYAGMTPDRRSWWRRFVDRVRRRRPDHSLIHFRRDGTPLPPAESTWQYVWLSSGSDPAPRFINSADPTIWPSAGHPQANVSVDADGNERPIGTPGAWRAFTGEVASELRSARPEPRTADEAQAELASALGRVLRRRMGLEG
jgi:hypothetical protein